METQRRPVRRTAHPWGLWPGGNGMPGWSNPTGWGLAFCREMQLNFHTARGDIQVRVSPPCLRFDSHRTFNATLRVRHAASKVRLCGGCSRPISRRTHRRGVTCSMIRERCENTWPSSSTVNPCRTGLAWLTRCRRTESWMCCRHCRGDEEIFDLRLAIGDWRLAILDFGFWNQEFRCWYTLDPSGIIL